MPCPPQLGASPLLLPAPLPALGTIATAAPAAASGKGGKGAAAKAAGREPAVEDAAKQGGAAAASSGAQLQPQQVPGKGIVDGLMPDEGTLRRSAFLSVLSPAVAKQYADLLQTPPVAAAAAK